MRGGRRGHEGREGGGDMRGREGGRRGLDL